MSPETQEPSPEDIDQLISQVPVALAIGYVALITGILIYVLCPKASGADSKDLITLLITSYTTLLGSALGYYFGRQED